MSDWRDRGACVGQDPDIFYVDEGEDYSEAREICQTCSVADQCLEHALANGEKWGCWGGTSPLDRRRLLKRRQYERRKAMARMPWRHEEAG